MEGDPNRPIPGRGQVEVSETSDGDMTIDIKSLPTDILVREQLCKTTIPLMRLAFSTLKIVCDTFADYLEQGNLPNTDILIHQTQIRGTAEEKAAIYDAALQHYVASGDQDRDDERENSDHDCGDPNCPHKKRIHYIMMLEDLERRMIQDVYRLDQWTPFEYIIADVGQFSTNVSTFYEMLTRQFGCLNDFRYCETTIFNSLKGERGEKTIKIDRIMDLLEGVYFPGAIPVEIRLYANETLRTVIKTSKDRRYYSVGFIPQCAVTSFSLGFYDESLDGELEIKVIKHLMSSYVLDYLTKRNFKCKIKPEFDTAVEWTSTNGCGWWKQEGVGPTRTF